MRAMIFAAGLGTRLKPLTDTQPKALIEIGGQTLLERLIVKLRNAGINDIVVNVHHFPDMIINYLNANNGFGTNWAVSDERDRLLETGGGLKKAQPLLSDCCEPILVHNVDIISNLDFQQLINAHQPDRLATLVVSRRDTQRYFLFDNNLRLCGWTNKATGEIRPNDTTVNNKIVNELAFSGIQVVSQRIFNEMADFGDKFSITELYLQKCGTNLIKGYVPQDYKMMDVGKINQLEQAEIFTKNI